MAVSRIAAGLYGRANRLSMEKLGLRIRLKENAKIPKFGPILENFLEFWKFSDAIIPYCNGSIVQCMF